MSSSDDLKIGHQDTCPNNGHQGDMSDLHLPSHPRYFRSLPWLSQLPYSIDIKTYHFVIRADSRFAPSKWETALLCNNVYYWLCVNLDSALVMSMSPWSLCAYVLCALVIIYVWSWMVCFHHHVATANAYICIYACLVVHKTCLEEMHVLQIHSYTCVRSCVMFAPTRFAQYFKCMGLDIIILKFWIVLYSI